VKAGDAPWSPQLHKAYLIHHYWNLKLSQKQMGHNYPHAFTAIEQQITPSRLQPAHLLTISANLRAAQKLLHDIQKIAQEKCQTHLDELIQATGICKDQRKRKLILCLKQAKELRGCYAMVRSITKPKQMGGISHVKIPTNEDQAEPTWESVFDPKEIERLVLQQHCKHFSQADGTVFMVAPLNTLINNECTSKYAQQILAGTANLKELPVDENTKLLLSNLKTKVLPHEDPQLPLDTEALIQGFKLWPERTSTSPSGRHLGIYKALAKHSPPPRIRPKKQIPRNPPTC